jgi:benzylsuccinate CoA-transferase BbsF subunit
MPNKVFDDIRVADLSWAAAGPGVGMFLASLGAEVIHIESRTRLDVLRTAGPYKNNKIHPDNSASFAQYNAGKYGISLNLRNPKGKEIVKKIVARSDVVLENMSPGAMKRLGLNFDELRKVKPDIIMLSASLQGQTGPASGRIGFGAQLSALSGFYEICGWPDRGPEMYWGAYTDYISIRIGLVALIAALDYRRKTGKGQYLDLSELEAGVGLLAPEILDYTLNGRVATRMGNRYPYAAPHGAFPCKEEDTWCAIAVFSDEEWQNLCVAMDNPEWASDPELATLVGRKANENKLEKFISEWTVNYKVEDLFQSLQKANVPAGIVQNAKEIHEDEQLNSRHQFWELLHSQIGKHNYESPAFILSETPVEFQMPAPCLGEHNEYVYKKILGLSDQEFKEFSDNGVFD